ncbi:MAG: hypothetical protein Q9166_006418 [cf. Caloplaca sp. 2 TL-2023]
MAERFDVTPLSYAVQQASFDTIKLMFQHGGSTAQGQLLNMASDRTDPDCVPILQFLFDHGDTRVNNTWLEDRPELHPWWGFDNATPLHHAARVGNIDAVRWLLEHGADPSKRSKRIIGCGTTPIDSATFMKHTEVVQLLLQATEDLYGSRDLPVPITSPPKNLDQAHAALFLGRPSDIHSIPQGNGVSNGQNHAIQDYSFYLMLLEIQSKKKAQMAHEEQNTPDDGQPGESLAEAADNRGDKASQDQQMQLMLEEQQNKKQSLMTRTDHGLPYDGQLSKQSTRATRQSTNLTYEQMTKRSPKKDKNSDEIPKEAHIGTHADELKSQEQDLQSNINPPKSGFRAALGW